MQFYENYVRLCNSIGKAPTGVAVALGISRATASRWSMGVKPSYANLVKLSDYFKVSVGELLGATAETVDEIAGEYGIAPSLLFRKPETADKPAETGLAAALEALRDQPGRRMLLAATSGMTEEQVEKMAAWLAEIRGGNKD